jgi:hypothetical protein
VELELVEYFGIAWFWIPYWEDRPWRPRNFPPQPKSTHIRQLIPFD